MDSTANSTRYQCWWFQFWGLCTNMRRRRWCTGVSLGHRSGFLERYTATTKHLWTVQTKTSRPVCLISATLITDVARKLVRLMIWRMTPFSFGVIVFNKCSHSPWIRLPRSRKRCMILEMAPCDTPICSIITGLILVGMTTTLAWDGNLHTAAAHSWMWSTQMHHTLGQLGNHHSRERKLIVTLLHYSHVIWALWSLRLLVNRLFFLSLNKSPKPLISDRNPPLSRGLSFTKGSQDLGDLRRHCVRLDIVMVCSRHLWAYSMFVRENIWNRVKQEFYQTAMV